MPPFVKTYGKLSYARTVRDGSFRQESSALSVGRSETDRHFNSFEQSVVKNEFISSL